MSPQPLQQGPGHKAELPKTPRAPWTPERRAARTAALRLRWENPVFRERVLAGQAAQRLAASLAADSPANNKADSEAAQRRWQDPVYRARNIAARAERAKMQGRTMGVRKAARAATPVQQAQAMPGQQAQAMPGQQTHARLGQQAQAMPGQQAHVMLGEQAHAMPGQQAYAMDIGTRLFKCAAFRKSDRLGLTITQRRTHVAEALS